ncbi:secreted RxLR effector protein 161-like [Hibiscus syriacus]|uniref:secreted RxLR effector protein 161-like n=1 Tax=Hibiscus syriacus TaxID=106335 RepID=UPI001921E057|nr:secreted RxLR effector protein 161-like [Hibiscus syriacus]
MVGVKGAPTAMLVSPKPRFLESDRLANRLCYRFTGRWSLDYGLVFKASNVEPGVTVFADANWASNVGDKRSVLGFCVYFQGNLVAWSFKRQKSASCFTTEIEYRGIIDVESEIVWLKVLLVDMNVSLCESPVIWIDNTSVVTEC